MVSPLLISLFLATLSFAENVAFPDSSLSISATTMSMIPPVYDFDTELKKLSKTCLSNEDHEQIWNNTMHHFLARLQNRNLIVAAIEIIGRKEMRTTLNFSPRRSWKSWGVHFVEKFGETLFSDKPSESELASATTIEAYYNLVEPRFVLTLPGMSYLEESMTPVIAFLDTRFPFIRAYYRRSFEKIRQLDGGEINRKLVDDMIHKFQKLSYKLGRAINPMFGSFGKKSKNCDVKGKSILE